MSGDCSFKLSHYKHCLELAKERGYKFLTMSEYISKREQLKNTKLILLRHDIDFNLDLALNFANIENDLGIKSTFFVRCHGKYNLLSLEGYRTIKKLLEMGHELGLHHDCDFGTLVKEDNEQSFNRDRKIFELVIGRKIAGVSSHEPNKSKFVIKDADLPRLGLQYQAYSDIFLKDMKYISDSSSRWREGCMCKFIESDVPKLTILTHPIWWFGESPLENY